MAELNINKAEFIKSAAAPSGFIRDALPNIVFSGKSNVGKSSVINRLLNRKNFARVGQSPGKTIHVNYFLIDKKVYFVDLPGYGYAKVSKAERERWGKLMEQFFAIDGLIDLGVMIVDSRHKPTADDVTMAEWFKSTGFAQPNLNATIMTRPNMSICFMGFSVSLPMFLAVLSPSL